MKKLTAFLVGVLLTSAGLNAQDTQDESSRPGNSGQFQLGLRTTMSLFGNEGYPGEGAGGQFRLRFGDKLSSEWFADYITTNLGDLGRRVDGHIGWSVMFYPFDYNGGAVHPYILAGHCFDYTKLNAFSSVSVDRSDQFQDRWSSAVQMGLGTHFYISEKVDLSLSAQYMQHLGSDIHATIEEHNGVKEIHIGQAHEEASSVGFEGHLLLTLSMNINIADLW